MDGTPPAVVPAFRVVAVMPFAAAGSADPPPFVVQGLHEDIRGALSRFRSIGVISPHSAMAVDACDDAKAGRRLGASHVLRGRLGGADGRLRLSASLVATAQARQLWSEEIELASDDPFALRDEIVARAAASLHARLDEVARFEACRGANAATGWCCTA